MIGKGLYTKKGCAGCAFEMDEGLCGYILKTGKSRVKLGARMKEGGGCAVRRREKRGKPNGICIKPMGAPKKIDETRAAELYDKGLNAAQIAREIGMTASGVGRWIRRTGRTPGKSGAPKKEARV